MPNLEEIELGAKLIAEGASAAANAFREELPAIFGGGAKTTVAGRVAGSPFAVLRETAEQSGHTGIIDTLREFFALPVEGKTLLSGADATRFTKLLTENTTEGLAKVHTELRTAVELGKEVPADRSAAAIIADIRRAGVPGQSEWLDRLAHLK